MRYLDHVDHHYLIPSMASMMLLRKQDVFIETVVSNFVDYGQNVLDTSRLWPLLNEVKDVSRRVNTLVPTRETSKHSFEDSKYKDNQDIVA